MSRAPVVLVLGGTSGIGRGVADAFARRGYDVIVSGRLGVDAQSVACDLAIRHGVEAVGRSFDAVRTETHQEFMSWVVAAVGDRLEGVVAAFGLLGDPEAVRADPASACEVIATNYTGMVSILTIVANAMERRGRGFIVGIGSVAGERGRQSNYVYGSSKGAVAIFLSGLRNRLHPSGVHVMTVKPGFIDTAMTYGLGGMFLVASPAIVAERIVRGVERRHDVVFVPWFWRPIMITIRLVPEWLFKRLKL